MNKTVSEIAKYSATTAATFLATSSSQGAVEYINTGFNFSVSGTRVDYYWDIDGDSTADIHLYGDASSVRASMNDEHDGAFATNLDSIVALNTTQYVNAAMNLKPIFFTFVSTSTDTTARINAAKNTDNYMGFSFKDSESKTYYGWAIFNYNFTAGDPYSFNLQIKEWAYENVAGAEIKVGDKGSQVPEPANAAAGIGALALGAAGLRKWRKNKLA